MVCDQYGRQIRRAVSNSGMELRFADTPPEGNKDGRIVSRPQFATHAQVIEALAEEKIDWMAYEVRWRDKTNNNKSRSGLTLNDASKLQVKLLQEGNLPVVMDRAIVCAGWPQLPYEMMKTLPELPPTPIEELRKIVDPQLRKDALRIKREFDEVRTKELQAVEDE